jgi:hypothetical protein
MSRSICPPSSPHSGCILREHHSGRVSELSLTQQIPRHSLFVIIIPGPCRLKTAPCPHWESSLPMLLSGSGTSGKYDGQWTCQKGVGGPKAPRQVRKRTRPFFSFLSPAVVSLPCILQTSVASADGVFGRTIVGVACEASKLQTLQQCEPSSRQQECQNPPCVGRTCEQVGAQTTPAPFFASFDAAWFIAMVPR